MRERCDEIAGLPGTLGRKRDDLGDDIRSVAWRDNAILFRYAGEEMEIIRIIHGQRDLPRIVSPTP